MTATTVPAERVAGRRPGFGRLLVSEWTKLRSVRSTIWSLIAFAVVAWGFTAMLTALVVASWNDPHTDPSDIAQVKANPTGFILGGGFSLGQLAICVLGVMVISSEYSTGMIRASVLAVPRRLPMLAAKSTMFALVVLVVGLAVSYVSFFIGSSLLHSKVPVSLGDPGVQRSVIGAALYLTVLGLFAMSLGAIVRHTAAGITGVIAVVLVIPPLIGLIPGSLGDHLSAYMPAQAGQLISQSHQQPGDLLSPWQGFGVFCLWVVVLMTIGAVLLKRRDA